jgi:cytochrome c oxidase cbb3-type subunit I
MSASSPATLQTSSPSGSVELSFATPAEVDRSCRAPVTLLFLCSALWLIIGLLMAMISSAQMHAPGMFANAESLTFGRMRPAATNALIYGFALQAGWAMALWMIARLGRVPLAGGGVIILATLFWNFGVKLGVAGILGGDSTGFELLEMPRYAAPILFLAYSAIGVCGIVTLHARRERSLYFSHWLLFAALLWFPWIYSTAELLLIYFPVRGVFQTAINLWFANNLIELCLGPMGLAAVFYFIPKLTGRPLYSVQVAAIAFWTLLFFGSLGGLYAGLPLPKWMTTVSILATVLLLVPLAAMAFNLKQTTAGVERGLCKSNLPLRFICAGTVFYFIAELLRVAGSLRSVNEVTRLTLFNPGVAALELYGFFLMVALGAFYYIQPRICDTNWASEKAIRFHFGATLLGVVLAAIPLLIGGVIQGFRIRNPSADFPSIARGLVPFIGLSTVGLTILALAQLRFLFSFAGLLRRCCCGGVASEASLKSEKSKGGQR